MKTKTEKIVHVIWEDACAGTGWTDLEQRVVDSKVCECHTVGILLKKTEDQVLVGLSIDPVMGDVNGTMMIPASCIRKFKVIARIEVKI